MRFWKDLPAMPGSALLAHSLWGRGLGLARRASEKTLDTIFPPQSLLTGAPSTGRDIESELWSAVQFLDDPCCTACGFPFDYDMGEGALCGRCASRHPAYDQARAAMAYNDVSRKLVLNFKHGGRTEGLPIFATHMARAARHMLPKADYIVPVPLHPTRLRKRRYNQSTLLARALAKRNGVNFDPDILKRVKATETQGGKTVSGRRRNVMAAFDVRAGAKARLANKTVVLIDDVFTTGATLEACARALKKGGAHHVYAITLARVVKPQDVPT